MASQIILPCWALTDIPSSRPWLLDFPILRSSSGIGRVPLVLMGGDLGSSRRSSPWDLGILGWAKWTQIVLVINYLCYSSLSVHGAWGMGYGHGPFLRIEQCHCSFARTLSRVRSTLELSVPRISLLPAICPRDHLPLEFKKEKGKIPGFRPLGRINWLNRDPMPLCW